MFARTWHGGFLAFALLTACGGDGDDGGNTDGTTPGDTDTAVPEPAAPLEVFVGSDWYGSCERGSSTFPCEADLTYDAGADQVVGTMDIDGVWEVVIIENEDGSFSGTGTPFFGDSSIVLSTLAVDGNMTGDWTIDYGGGNTTDGTLSMSPDGAM